MPASPRRALAEPAPRARQPLLLIALLALVALLVAALATAWLRWAPGDEGRLRSATAPAGSGADLLDPAALVELGSSWRLVEDVATVSDATASPTCLPGTPTGPAPQASTLRRLVGGDGATLLHRLDTHADERTAAAAYAARRAELATCADAVLITAAATPLALGDDALVLEARAELAEPVAHAILLLRVGRGVEVLDLGRAGAAVDPREVVAAARTVVPSRCAALGGSCAVTGLLVPEPPPAGIAPGFLQASDLPRVTPGIGRWAATAPSPVVELAGSSCEAVPLGTVEAGRRFQRTLVLLDDERAGTAFGIDEVVLELASPDAAVALLAELENGWATCSARVPTAVVEGVTPVSATGAAAGRGSTARVRQAAADREVVYRTAAMAVGARLVYLVETPRVAYDLNDDRWAAVAERAAARAAQLG